jgi:hypothetical protein
MKMSDPQGTFAWLVVVARDSDSDSRVSDSDDWPDGSPLYKHARGWTHDVLQALRYARSDDAEAVADAYNENRPSGSTPATFEEHGFAPVRARDVEPRDDDPPNESHYL